MSCRDHGNARHWFTMRGLPGVPTKVCVRPNCEAVNPRFGERLDAMGWTDADLVGIK